MPEARWVGVPDNVQFALALRPRGRPVKLWQVEPANPSVVVCVGIGEPKGNTKSYFGMLISLMGALTLRLIKVFDEP